MKRRKVQPKERQMYDRVDSKKHHKTLEGDKAHAFDLETQLGKSISLKDFKGKYLVLYFYPKDNTSGCTLEGIEFNKLLKNFQKLNCEVFGISKDSVLSHKKFAKEHDFKFGLGSDADIDTCKKYGVYVEKSMYGKKTMGIERATFLIDPKGVVVKVWRKVNAKGHAADVLDTLKKIQE